MNEQFVLLYTSHEGEDDVGDPHYDPLPNDRCYVDEAILELWDDYGFSKMYNFPPQASTSPVYNNNGVNLIKGSHYLRIETTCLEFHGTNKSTLYFYVTQPGDEGANLAPHDWVEIQVSEFNKIIAKKEVEIKIYSEEL